MRNLSRVCFALLFTVVLSTPASPAVAADLCGAELKVSGVRVSPVVTTLNRLGVPREAKISFTSNTDGGYVTFIVRDMWGRVVTGGTAGRNRYSKIPCASYVSTFRAGPRFEGNQPDNALWSADVALKPWSLYQLVVTPAKIDVAPRTGPPVTVWFATSLKY